jgi:hypothetical protein
MRASLADEFGQGDDFLSTSDMPAVLTVPPSPQTPLPVDDWMRERGFMCVSPADEFGQDVTAFLVLSGFGYRHKPGGPR